MKVTGPSWEPTTVGLLVISPNCLLFQMRMPQSFAACNPDERCFLPQWQVTQRFTTTPSAENKQVWMLSEAEASILTCLAFRGWGWLLWSVIFWTAHGYCTRSSHLRNPACIRDGLSKPHLAEELLAVYSCWEREEATTDRLSMLSISLYIYMDMCSTNRT